MSQSETLKQGVYKQGDEVIVVLPSDKVVIIEEVVAEPAVPVAEVHHPTTLQKIQDKIHQLFEHKPSEPQVISVQVTPVQGKLQSTELQNFDFNRTLNTWKQCWRTFDDEAAFHMTEFKRKYVLPIGDIPVRSVCMAVSTGLLYALLGRRNPSLVARTRNLALSFLVNGSFWLPESFNPFLFRQTRI